jgi:hypothetical protein
MFNLSLEIFNKMCNTSVILMLFILLYFLEYRYINTYCKVKVQVKFTLEEVMKAWVGIRGTVLLFL